MPTPTAFGSEFLVNTTTTDDQLASSVIGLANGRFVVVWSDDSKTGGDVSGSAIRAQRFNADGTKAGAEFLVNTNTTFDQTEPAITALADGRFVVTWSDNSLMGGDPQNWAIHAQIYNANGSRAGAEFLVNSTKDMMQMTPSITALANGGFVVTWDDFSQTGDDTSGYAVRGQVYKANGTKLGAEFVVNTTTSSHQQYSAVTKLANGGFVVTWRDNSLTGGDNENTAIRAQVFNANGTKSGAEFLVNTTTKGFQTAPAITALSDGRFVVSWSDGSATGDDLQAYAIRSQVFNANGTKSGAEFVVNTTTAENQVEPTIAALAGGRFVVAWVDESRSGGDTSGSAIRAQVFNADGTKSGDEFLVNTTTTSNQNEPSITVLADGRFVVTWTNIGSTDLDPMDFGVHGQIFDARDAAIKLAGTKLNDQFLGTGFADTISGGEGADKLTGLKGADRLNGGKGNDQLTGGAGADEIKGGKGADTLTGGTGKDVLTGGDGNDHFIFAKAGQANGDRIVDFAPGDKIDLSAFMDGGKFIGAAAFKPAGTQAEVRYDKATGRLQGDVDGNGTVDWSLTLANKAALVTADFLF